MHTSKKDVVAVIGSTGTGKSQLAVSLAKVVASSAQSAYKSAEVISVDSMQVYQGLDVITNKVTEEEKEGVPHHLIDFLEPGQEYTVGNFCSDASSIIDKLEASDEAVLPILAGGTTYYAQHFLLPGRLLSAQAKSDAQGLESAGGTAELPGDIVRIVASLPQEERRLWEAALVDSPKGPLATPEDLEDPRPLWELLRKVDPAMAARWHYKDVRKVLRSIRVLQTTGKRHSEWIREQDAREKNGNDEGTSPWRILLFWVWRDPVKLNASLAARIHQMIERGLLEEIKALRRLAGENLEYTRGIFQAIGYKEFDPYLSHIQNTANSKDSEHAKHLFDQGVEEMQIATRQYAKKQVSWIRNKLLPEIRRRQVQDSQKGEPSSVEIFLLDVTEGTETPTRKATEILFDWVGHKPLPDPATLSTTARERLTPLYEVVDDEKGDTDTLGSKGMRLCEVCSSGPGREEVWIRATEWQQHCKGRSHQGALRAQGRDERIAKMKQEGERLRRERENLKRADEEQ